MFCFIIFVFLLFRYTWQKNGKPYDWQVYDDRISQQPGRGTLVITSPRDEDIGMYFFLSLSYLTTVYWLSIKKHMWRIWLTCLVDHIFVYTIFARIISFLRLRYCPKNSDLFFFVVSIIMQNLVNNNFVQSNLRFYSKLTLLFQFELFHLKIKKNIL